MNKQEKNQEKELDQSIINEEVKDNCFHNSGCLLAEKIVQR